MNESLKILAEILVWKSTGYFFSKEILCTLIISKYDKILQKWRFIIIGHNFIPIFYTCLKPSKLMY